MSNLGPSKVGEAYVEITARTQPLKDALGDAKVETQKAVDDMANTTDKGGKRITDSFQKSVGAITAFAGSLTAAVGVFVTFFKLGKSVGGMLESNATQAEKFVAALGKGNPELIVRRTSEEIGKMSATLAAIQSNQPLGRLLNVDQSIKGLLKFQGLTESVQSKILAFEKERASAQTIIDNAVKIAQRITEDKILEDSADRQRRITIDLAEGEERLTLENAELNRKIDIDIANAKSVQIEAAFRQEKKLINEAYDIRLGRMKQEKQDNIRELENKFSREDKAESERVIKATESARKQGEALENAFSSAIQSAGRQTDALNGRIVTTLEAIERIASTINSSNPRRR